MHSSWRSYIAWRSYACLTARMLNGIFFPASKHAQQEARQHQAHPLLWWARSESHLDALFLYLAQKIQINNAVGTFNLKFSPPNFSGCIFWHWKPRRPRPVAPAPSATCSFVQFWPFATCIFVHDALASPCPPCRAVRAVRQRRKAPRRPRPARPPRAGWPRPAPCRARQRRSFSLARFRPAQALRRAPAIHPSAPSAQVQAAPVRTRHAAPA